MIGYEAMAIAAKDPDVQVSWGHRCRWYPYKEMKCEPHDTGFHEDGWVIRRVKRTPVLPDKVGAVYSSSELVGVVDKIIDYLKSKE